MASTPSLTEITLPEVQSLLESGALTSTQLVRACLARITEVDHEFHSVIETDPDALAIAQARDVELAADQRRSDPHGLPILLKDNIPTLDNTETTCGSLALVGAKPWCEAAVVTKLRDAGAIILGKANMAEWVGFRSSSGCSGWSPRGGQTYGPYVKGSKASGSSSGSAVATALGLCFAAIGTETCWSIVSPAEKSGIVGYKPTKGLIPSEGIIYASKKQDTVGVLTRTVEDAMHITHSLIVESVGYNSLRRLPKSTNPIEFMDSLSNAIYPKKLSLYGLRIGVPNDLIEFEVPSLCKLGAFGRALFRLETKGAKVVTKVVVQGWCEYEKLSQEQAQIVLDTDMKVAINDYLSDLHTNPQTIHNLEDLIDFTKTCPEEEFSVRNVAGLERAQATDPDSELYQTMLEKDKYFASCIEDTLDQYNCDMLMIPFLSPTLQTFAAKAGSPVMSVPLGVYPDDTPVAIDPRNGLVTNAPGIP